MEGIFPKTLRQAYHLTKSYKFFWLMGLFLVWPLFFRSFILLFDLGITLRLPGFEMGTAPTTSVEQPSAWIAILSLAFIIVGVIYYFRSKAALITATKQLRDKKTLEPSLIYEQSEPYTIQLLKLSFSLMALLFILSAFLMSPVAYLTTSDYANRAFLLGILAMVVYIPLFGLIFYAMVFAPMFMVLQRMTVRNSLLACFDLFRRRWPLLLGFSIIILALEIILLAVTILLTVVAVAPFVLLFGIFYDIGGQTGLVIGQSLAVIVGFVVFLFSQGIISAFQRIAWTILFFEIVKPVKFESPAEPATVPEVA